MKKKNSLDELKAKSAKELAKLSQESDKKLVKARFAFAMGKTEKLNEIRSVRKYIARTQTLLNQKLDQLSESNKKS